MSPYYGPTGGGGGGTSFGYQIPVSSHGAVGDGLVLNDVAMTSGSAVMTSASATFTTADVGKHVLVSGAAGGQFSPLMSTIVSINSGTSVNLVAAATSNVTSSITIYGTDDAAAIQATINAAVTYAQAHHGYAEVVFDGLIYCLGSAPVLGGATLGNALLTLPLIPTTLNKVTLVFRGVIDATALPHWQQLTPNISGTTLAGLRTDGSVDGTFGPTSVLGGPFSGYGTQTSVFSNCMPVLDGIAAMVPYNGTIAGFDFYGMAEADVIKAACNAIAIVPAAANVPTMGQPANFTNFGYFGLRMPSTNNNANTNIDWFSVEGMVNGVRVSEHSVFESLRIINCYAGLVPYIGGGGDMAHSMWGAYACIENCVSAIVTLDPGLTRVRFEHIDTEVINNALLDDSGNALQGDVFFSQYAQAPVVTGGANVRMINMRQVSGVATAPGIPATTVAFQNPFWRDATVTVTGGAVTVIAVSGTALGITSGSFLVPSGKTVTLTYTVAPTWKWVLS